MKSELVDFAAVKVMETDSAILLDHGDEEEAWFPKSIIEDNGDGTYTVPEWWAMEKGVI